MRSGIIPSTRRWFAATFHGLTWRRVGIVFLFIAAHALFSWVVAVSAARDLGAAGVAEAFARSAAATTLWFVPALLAGVAVYNRAPGPFWIRVAAAAIAMCATVWTLRPLTVLIGTPADLRALRSNAGGIWIWSSALVAMVAGTLLFITHDEDTARSLEAEALRAIALDRGLAEARLIATQAQIEPHFLFNTLANIRRLYQTDPAVARPMLHQFSRMLGAALPRMRDARSTLGREAALAVAYLSVQKIRMAERLEFEVDVPSSLNDAEVPPMMISTLVENAIKHGLAPLPEGGRVRIAAEGSDGVLRIRIADTGRGLTEGSGPGVGLANIEIRLAAMFGPAGTLSLDQNDFGGVTATLGMPLRMASVEWERGDDLVIA
jgi:signal transduction histidine kinase